MKNHAVVDNKDSLYVNALLTLSEKFKKNAASAEINYELANYYFEKGNGYIPEKKEELKWLKKKP